MTDRHAPTPAGLAARAAGRRGTPLAATAAPARQAPAAGTFQAGAPYDRTRWERAVMSSGLHPFTRLTGLTLAHYAPGGVLGEAGIQNPGGLTGRTGMAQRRVRQCLRDLEKAGLITRPPIDGWQRRDVPRPITLTIPAAATRGEPPHSGRRP